MRNECLVVATLEAFSEEDLAYEMARRSGKKAHHTLANAVTLHERNRANAKMLRLLDPKAHVPSTRARLQEVVCLADFDMAALIDEIEMIPNYRAAMNEQLGVVVLEASARTAIARAITTRNPAEIIKAISDAVDPKTREFWRDVAAGLCTPETAPATAPARKLQERADA